jgi:Domain of unknown function (DUF4443)
VPSVSALLRQEPQRRQGPTPSFDRAHLLLAFVSIGESDRIGRHALALKAGLGEGSIRTVLKRLKDEGFADSDASGCHLTPGGTRAYESLRMSISKLVEIEDPGLSIGAAHVAVKVTGAEGAVRGGIEQRDAAILSGASGALTYVIRRGRFAVPGGSSDCEKEFPGSVWDEVRGSLGPLNGDAVIVCGGKDEVSAKVGAISAALTLV